MQSGGSVYALKPWPLYWLEDEADGTEGLNNFICYP